MADKANLSGHVTDLSAFAHNYLEVFSRGYNYAFGIAALAMIISLLVYIFFNKLLPNKEKKVVEVSEKVEFKPLVLIMAIAAMVATAFGLHFIPQVGWKDGFAFGLFAAFIVWLLLTARKEEMSRLIALILVFIVVVFFWMSFHQNGLSLTFFARDYTVKEVTPFTSLFFNLWSILAVIGSVAGLVILLNKNIKGTAKDRRRSVVRCCFYICLFQTYKSKCNECNITGDISVIQPFIHRSTDISGNGIILVA